jgi:hypothetical protein
MQGQWPLDSCWRAVAVHLKALANVLHAARQVTVGADYGWRGFRQLVKDVRSAAEGRVKGAAGLACWRRRGGGGF